MKKSIEKSRLEKILFLFLNGKDSRLGFTKGERYGIIHRTEQTVAIDIKKECL